MMMDLDIDFDELLKPNEDNNVTDSQLTFYYTSLNTFFKSQDNNIDNIDNSNDSGVQEGSYISAVVPIVQAQENIIQGQQIVNYNVAFMNNNICANDTATESFYNYPVGNCNNYCVAGTSNNCVVVGDAVANIVDYSAAESVNGFVAAASNAVENFDNNFVVVESVNNGVGVGSNAAAATENFDDATAGNAAATVESVNNGVGSDAAPAGNFDDDCAATNTMMIATLSSDVINSVVDENNWLSSEAIIGPRQLFDVNEKCIIEADDERQAPYYIKNGNRIVLNEKAVRYLKGVIHNLFPNLRHTQFLRDLFDREYKDSFSFGEAFTEAFNAAYRCHQNNTIRMTDFNMVDHTSVSMTAFFQAVSSAFMLTIESFKQLDKYKFSESITNVETLQLSSMSACDECVYYRITRSPTSEVCIFNIVAKARNLELFTVTYTSHSTDDLIFHPTEDLFLNCCSGSVDIMLYKMPAGDDIIDLLRDATISFPFGILTDFCKSPHFKENCYVSKNVIIPLCYNSSFNHYKFRGIAYCYLLLKTLVEAATVIFINDEDEPSKNYASVFRDYQLSANSMFKEVPFEHMFIMSNEENISSFNHERSLLACCSLPPH